MAAGTVLSWWMTGHVFGRSNNVFHLPIVAGLSQRPGFEGDAFVQSLAGFASGLWMLLEGSDAHWPAPSLFAWGLVVTKALTLGGALAVAQALGLAGRGRMLAFVAVLATAPLLQGAAYAGHGGLFVDYFSHSELAAAVMLWMWAALLHRRFDIALALLGGVAFLNAFVAAWSVLPLAVVAGAAWRDATAAAPAHTGEAPTRQRFSWPSGSPDRAETRALLLGGAVAALLVAPVAWRVLAPPAASRAALADLRPFVREYFPYHFLAAEMPLGQWLGLAAVLVAAFVGLRWLRDDDEAAAASQPNATVASNDPPARRAARDLQRLLLAYLAVYALGVVAPLVSGAPWIIQLHLLRVSVVFHLVAAIVLALLLVRPGGPLWRRLLLVAALLTVRPALLLLAPVGLWMLARRARPGRMARPFGVTANKSGRTPIAGSAQPDVAAAPAEAHPTSLSAALSRRGPVAVSVIALVAALVAAVQAWQWPVRLARQAALADSSSDWQALARRVGELTPPGSTVLLPLVTDAEPGEAGSGVFEYASSRSVWVDHKRGAAVLWQPAYLATWRERRAAVAALADVPQRLAYASQQGLAMVVERCEVLPAGTEPAARAGRWCALRPPAAPTPEQGNATATTTVTTTAPATAMATTTASTAPAPATRVPG